MPGCDVHSGECSRGAQPRDDTGAMCGMRDAVGVAGQSQRPEEVYVDHEAEDDRELAAAAL